MHKKSYPHSLCYGFIFNLLVALCTIGFLCYFLYRFDSRLVSLERRLWDKERDERVTAGRKPAFLKHENHNEREHLKKKNRERLESSHLRNGFHARARKKQRERLLKLSAWDAQWSSQAFAMLRGPLFETPLQYYPGRIMSIISVLDTYKLLTRRPDICKMRTVSSF